MLILLEVLAGSLVSAWAQHTNPGNAYGEGQLLKERSIPCGGSDFADMVESACSFIHNNGFEPWINGGLGNCKVPHRRSPVHGLCHKH